MVKPPRKYTLEEKAAYNQARLEREASQHDLNQNRLKQEGITQYKDNCGKKIGRGSTTTMMIYQ